MKIWNIIYAVLIITFALGTIVFVGIEMYQHDPTRAGEPRVTRKKHTYCPHKRTYPFYIFTERDTDEDGEPLEKQGKVETKEVRKCESCGEIT